MDEDHTHNRGKTAFENICKPQQLYWNSIHAESYILIGINHKSKSEQTRLFTLSFFMFYPLNEW